MTPEQKRAHLALHGVRALVLTSTAEVRLARDVRHQAEALYAPIGGESWQSMPLATPDKYTEIPFSQVSNELLDRLDLSRIEHFLSTN